LSSFRKLVLAGIAVLAVAAFVGVSSASAFTVYKEDGSNVTASTAVSLTDGSGGLTLAKPANGIFHPAATVNCSGTGSGTVNSGGAGTVTASSSTSCTKVSGTCPTPISASAANLNWTTAISGTRVNLTNAGNNVGWSVNCGGAVVTCTASSSSAALTNGTNVVNGTFDNNTPTASCSDGATGATVSGTVISSISGHSLQVA
jgi:hypothetical protein